MCDISTGYINANLNIEFDSREHKRKTYNSIRNFGIWQGVVLLFTGFFGGIFTGISGSGVDICSFSMLCLLFRVSEKVATPTSIVLMAINTCIGKKHLQCLAKKLVFWPFMKQIGVYSNQNKVS